MRTRTARACTTFLAALFTGLAGCASNASVATPDGTAKACGTVSMIGPNPPSDQGALQAEQCFLTAYTACQPATLTVENRGVDVFSTTTFTIQTGLSCHVDGTTQTTFVPQKATSSTFMCASVTSRNGGLVFVSCGQSGDIVVPAPTP